METKFGNFNIKYLLNNTAIITKDKEEFIFYPKGLDAFCKMLSDKVEKTCKLKDDYIVEFEENNIIVKYEDKKLILTKEEASELSRIHTLGV